MLAIFFLLSPSPPRSTLFPYTTLFRSAEWVGGASSLGSFSIRPLPRRKPPRPFIRSSPVAACARSRSEEHTSELQSPCNLVCRLLLAKKNTIRRTVRHLACHTQYETPL